MIDARDAGACLLMGKGKSIEVRPERGFASQHILAGIMGFRQLVGGHACRQNSFVADVNVTDLLKRKFNDLEAFTGLLSETNPLSST